MQTSLRQAEEFQKWQSPQFFDVTNEAEYAAMESAVNENCAVRFFDPMEHAINELYDIHYPHEKDLPVEQKSNFDSFKQNYAWPIGTYVYFPWDNTLVRFPGKEELRALRTSRNRNLINAEEQKTLYNATIFIAGLSVGSSIVEALVSMGIGGKFIIADMDIIEPSNLNRIRAPYHTVGTHKADSVAMRMSQIDPFIGWELYQDGLTAENIVEILDTHKPHIIIDEMDQLPLKVKLRREAKKRRLAVLSAADDGDSALLDVEPYDTDAEYPIYHDMIPKEILLYLEQTPEIPRQELGMLIGKYFIGAEHIPLRMYESLSEVGKTLPSWPQLGGAAAQSGLAVAYAARRILLKQPVNAGRFVIGSEHALNPDLDNAEHKAALAKFQDRLNGLTSS